MLSGKDFRLTRQRRIILEEMRDMRRHPSACELYEAVRNKLPHISLATVYRNLEILSEMGLIKKITAVGRQKRFDINPEEHCHAHCVQCGEVIDVQLDSGTILHLTNGSEALGDFRVTEARVVFFGYCAACGHDLKPS